MLIVMLIMMNETEDNYACCSLKVLLFIHYLKKKRQQLSGDTSHSLTLSLPKHRKYIQFSSVAQSCLTLCDLMDCSTPGFTGHHQLIPEAYFKSCPVSQWCHPTISSSVVPFSFCLQSFSASGSFPMSQFFPPGSQSTRVSASASVLSMNIQDWFPLEWTDSMIKGY